MNINVQDNLNNIQMVVSHHTKQTMQSKKKFKKLPDFHKLEIQKLVKGYTESSVLDLYLHKKSYSEMKRFIPSLFCVVLDTDELELSLSISTNIYQFINFILEDRDFKDYLKYSLMNGNSENIIGSNIISKLFLYIYKDMKITIPKIKDFLSLYISKSGVNLEINSTLTTEQKIILEQIRTGVKYEKEVNQTPANRIGYKKSNKQFSIIDTTNNFIKIKYISNKNNKHSFHKSPKEHYRRGYWRHYKNGNVIWVEPTIINQGCA